MFNKNILKPQLELEIYSNNYCYILHKQIIPSIYCNFKDFFNNYKLYNEFNNSLIKIENIDNFYNILENSFNIAKNILSYYKIGKYKILNNDIIKDLTKSFVYICRKDNLMCVDIKDLKITIIFKNYFGSIKYIIDGLTNDDEYITLFDSDNINNDDNSLNNSFNSKKRRKKNKKKYNFLHPNDYHLYGLDNYGEIKDEFKY